MLGRQRKLLPREASRLQSPHYPSLHRLARARLTAIAACRWQLNFAAESDPRRHPLKTPPDTLHAQTGQKLAVFVGAPRRIPRLACRPHRARSKMDLGLQLERLHAEGQAPTESHSSLALARLHKIC